MGKQYILIGGPQSSLGIATRWSRVHRPILDLRISKWISMRGGSYRDDMNLEHITTRWDESIYVKLFCLSFVSFNFSLLNILLLEKHILCIVFEENPLLQSNEEMKIHLYELCMKKNLRESI